MHALSAVAGVEQTRQLADRPRNTMTIHSCNKPQLHRIAYCILLSAHLWGVRGRCRAPGIAQPPRPAEVVGKPGTSRWNLHQLSLSAAVLLPGYPASPGHTRP